MKTFSDYGIKVSPSDSGRKYKLCPQCSHTRSNENKSKPCLSIYITGQHPDTGYWKCHNCGWTGGIKEPDNFEHTYTRPVFTKQRKYNEETYELLPESGLPQKIVEYFASRGIPEWVLADFLIDYKDTHYFPDCEKNLPAVMFPYFVGDQVVDIKYRGRNGNKKTFSRVTGAEHVAYNLNSVTVENPLIWVEGEVDVLSIASLGGKWGCISPPLGAPQVKDKTVEGKFKFWEPFSELFLSVNKHIIATDKDGPGRRLADELIKRLGPERCWTVELPEDCKDVNDVLKKHGADVLREIIDDAHPVPVSGLVDVMSLADRVFDLYEYGASSGESTGWYELDKYYTVKRKQVTLVTGIPSHGKSNWLDALAVNLAKNSEWKFVVFSPEMEPTERHIAQLVSKWNGKPFLQKYRNRMDRTELAEGICWVHEHFTFIELDEEDPTLDTLLAKVKAQIARAGVDGIVLDPWNEIDHTRPAHMSETEWISKCLTTIRKFAIKYDVHVWIVAHPRIMTPEKNLKGESIYPVPTPYHVSGSANWRNKPHNCIALWADLNDKSCITQVHIQKVRYDEVGKVGVVELRFDIPTGKYFSQDYYPPPIETKTGQEELVM